MSVDVRSPLPLVASLIVLALATAPAAAGPYPDEVKSVRILDTTTLRTRPDGGADKVGVIRKGTRAPVRAEAPAGNGCERRWIELEPRGWACETALEPTTEPPFERVVGELDTLIADVGDGAAPAVSGKYGIVRGSNVVAYGSADDAASGVNGRALTGKNSVRLRGSVTIDGRRFMRIGRGELIDASAVRRTSPSEFHGVLIADAARMPAWARSRHGSKRTPVTVYDAPARRAARVGELAPRAVVTIVESSPDGRYARVGDAQWVRRTDLRVSERTAPPDSAEPGEKWFDVDLDEQVLVAYEGERPVYATLVSTGKREHRTPTRVTRISSKLEARTMRNDTGDVYSVADVPWTMYYDHRYALHGSYWHDGFGGERSHGCINLAPRDARALYHWSSPDVPPGWTAVYGGLQSPGSLVRVRSHRHPEPALRGYARTLRDRRVFAISAE